MLPRRDDYANVNSSSADEEDPARNTAGMIPRSTWASKRKWLGVVVGSLAVVAFVATARALVRQQGRPAGRRVYIPGSHPAFANYDALPVDGSITGAEPLCSPSIVRHTCEVWNNETLEYWGGAIDASLYYVHAKELAQSLSISSDSVKDFFRSLGFADKDQEHVDSFAVSCQELCEKTVGAFEPKQLPGASDVACVQVPNKPPSCNVNIHPNLLQNITFKGHSASGAVQQYDETKAMKAAAPITNGEKRMNRNIARANPATMHPNESPDQIKHAIAKGFRIFPKLAPAFDHTGNVGFEWFGPDEPQVRTARRALLSANPAPEGRKLRDDWQEITAQAQMKAIGYINLALSQLNSRMVPGAVVRWFGSNEDTPVRAEIKRALNAILGMLDNVHFVYPGDRCSPRTYAYVYPNSPYNRDSAGRYLFYLCDYYMGVDENERIETLTHEGAHHDLARLDDPKFPPEGTTMYGRKFCKYVADQCKDPSAANHDYACAKVLNNADSLSYFINDAALAPAGGVPIGAAATDNSQVSLSGSQGSQEQTGNAAAFASSR